MVSQASGRHSGLHMEVTVTRREVASFKAYDGGMSKMAFTSDGKRLVTSGKDGAIKVWDVEKILPAQK